MKKSKGIFTLLLVLLAITGLIYLAAFGVGEEKAGAASNIKQGLDLAGGVSITYEVSGEKTPSIADMDDTVYKLQQRVNTYSTEAIVYQEGSKRINIEIPGETDEGKVLTELGKPGSLYFLMEDGTVVITGSDVIDANAGVVQDDMGNNVYTVKLEITKGASKIFEQATAAAIGRPIYIIYDDQQISAPTVQQKISGTTVNITNMESMDAANRLASQIRIGGLKVNLDVLRSNVVGAQLGQKAIETSLLAGLIGTLLVMIIMLVVYRIAGLASGIALLGYCGLMLGSLNAFDVTLTLPGIAGIILSIGMAVDANVIIFARIKEEIGTGKTVKSAIKIGFQKALSAILDGNITTLIAALVLFVMGTGSVKGFAETLAIGIIISMFTALVVTRLLLYALYAIGLKSEKFYGKIVEKKPFDFLGKRKIFFAISSLIVLVGIIFAFTNISKNGDALNYGLDFKGGTSTSVTFNKVYDIDEIKSEIQPSIQEITGDSDIYAQTVNGSNEIIFKTRGLIIEERSTFKNMMVEKFNVDPLLINSETISSTISSEMRIDAIMAVLIATICMLIYIWFRFKDIRFATSSVLALLHDVIIVLIFYVIAWITVGNTFVACMLTIVGYSINATIVIFDRIRENLLEAKRNTDMKDVVNRSITQTLSRSIFTSLTTFVMVGLLYVLGVQSIKDFALPLMVGILCGTYSSVCLSGAFWYSFRVKNKICKK